jgi:hypothetical protein
MRITRHKNVYTIRLTITEMGVLRAAMALVDWRQLYRILDTSGRRSLSRRGSQAQFLSTDRVYTGDVT